MRTWNLQIHLSRSSESLVTEIASRIVDAIRDGRLQPGDPLPGARTLAKQLAVNRNTVAAAYVDLVRQGWIVTQPGSSSFVSSALPGPANVLQERQNRQASRVGFSLPPPINPLLDEPSRGRLKWDFGSPDVRLCPNTELVRAYRKVLLNPRKRHVLDYNRYKPEGERTLHHSIAQMLSATRGLAVNAEDIEITRGSQMGLFLVAQVLLSKGDTIAIEDPGHWAMVPLFRTMGVNVLPIPVDAEGLQVEVLRAKSREIPIRAVLVTPHNQFPTTVPLSARRRLELLRLASDRRMAVIEDDFDHEFHYEGRANLPLISHDDAGVVVHIGTLSKIFAPGIRLGYVTGPQRVMDRVRMLRDNVDGGGDTVLEAAIAELFDDGEMQRHVNRARRIYAARRDHLDELLRRLFPGILSFDKPSGGLAFWVHVDPSVDLADWETRAKEKGLLFRTGHLFYLDEQPRSVIRLGFARMNEAEAIQAAELLLEALPAGNSKSRPNV